MMPEDINKTKENLTSKKQELEELNQQILAETEKLKKEELEKQKAKLEEEIKELEAKYAEEQKATINDINKEKENLQGDVELPNTYDLIKGTTMHTSLLEYYDNNEGLVEDFSNKIKAPVDKYLNQELVGVDEKIIQSLSIAIQFSMMEQLANEGQKDMSKAFSGFGKMDTGGKETEVSKGNITSVFNGMFGFFSQSGGFFKLAKRVDNLTTILKFHKSELQVGPTKLTNPLECKNLLNDAKWDNIKEEEGQTLEQLGITTTVQIDPQWQEKLKQIPNNEKLKMTKEMIESLSGATDKAFSFLEKRVDYKNKILDLVKTGDSWMDIGIPGIFTLGTLLGKKKGGSLLDIFGKENKITNFILKILGFGSIDGLKKEITQAKIDGNMSESGKEFITAVLGKYAEEIQKPENQEIKTEDDLLQVIGGKKNEKISISYAVIKKQIEENIKTNPEKIITPEIAKEFGFPVEEVTEGETKKLQITSLEGFDAEKFTDQFLKTKVKNIVEDGDCMEKIESSKNPNQEFLLTVIGSITAGTVFKDGVSLGVQTAYMYNKQSQETPVQTTTDTKIEEYAGGDLLYADRVKGTPEEQKQFLEKVKQVAKNLGTNINPNWLMFVMNGESGFDPKIVNGKTNATGLIQFMPKTATALGTTTEELSKMTAIQQLDYVEKFYLLWKKKLPEVKTYKDLALLTFYPAVVGKTGEYNIGGADVATDNPGFDTNKDKQITSTEYTAVLNSKIEKDVPEQFRDQFVA